MSNTHVHPLFQAILAPYTPPQSSLRWVDVSKAFDSQHPKCESCDHRHAFEDEGSEDGKHGIRYFHECRLGYDRRDLPSMCPALQPTNESDDQP